MNKTMTNRENFFNFITGKPFKKVPYHMVMCGQLVEKFKNERSVSNYEEHYNLPFRYAGIKPTKHPVDFSEYFKGKDIDFVGEWGDGHKFGSVEHFTRFIPSMDRLETIEEINAFPLPDVLADYRWEGSAEEIAALKDQDFIVLGNATIDLFEQTWYLRGLEELLMDFYVNPELACACLDRVKNVKTEIAKRLAKAGVDIIVFGDDVAMQTGMMMSPQIWREFLKPRLREMIAAAKEANPNVLCYYHTDGDARLIIPELIEIGVEILNPIQPECMNPVEIYNTYKDKIAFWGGIGTQTTMPFGDTEEVQRKTTELLDLIKNDGKFVLAPTHLLEPEVPLCNIETFAKTVAEFSI